MKLIKKFLSRLRLVLIGDTFGKLRKLEHWQWLDKDQVKALQHKRINDLLLHAFEHVPYYREVLQSAGVVNASGAVNVKSFDKIPLLDKAKIRSFFEDLKCDNLALRKWHKNSSGGSTGEPVTFIQDSVYTDWKEAAKILYDSWTGCSIAARKIRLWGSIRDLSHAKESFKIRFIKWINNDLWLNAFRMTPFEMRTYVRRINEFKPDQILSYAESIYELACFIEKEKLRVYSPNAIMTSAGTLFPHMRDTIGRVFKTNVFNRYGSREVGDIACECPQHNGLHVCVPTHYVEVIRADGSKANIGELGEIVVTSLVNYAMPLIRYRIGDMGIRGDHFCPCGRTWPLLKEVTGRVTDVFVRRDGGIVSPEYLIHLIGVELNNGWIRKYQVVQEEYDRLRILIVTNEKVDNPMVSYSNETTEIFKGIRLAMGQDCRIECEFVEDIAPSVSGKYQYTISKLAR